MIFSAGCNEDNEDCCDEVCDWWNTENDSVAGHTFTISTKTQIDTITSLFMITAGQEQIFSVGSIEKYLGTVAEIFWLDCVVCEQLW